MRSRWPLVENELQAQILRYVRDEGPVTRAQLVARLGVSRSRVSPETSQLLNAGLLVEQGFADPAGGRPSSLIGISRSTGVVVGVELGVTSISVVLSTLGLETLGYRSEDADIRDGPGIILERVRESVAGLLAEKKIEPDAVASIGMGVPGPVEHASGMPIAAAQMPGWHRYPIRSAFTGDYAAPVFVDNEVNLMALAEHRFGVGKGIDEVLFVKVGTGIGAGLIVHGSLYRGANGAAGDIGHICVDRDGPFCPCGNRGCLGAMAGARSLLEEAAAAAQDGRSPFLASLENGGRPIDGYAMAEAVASADTWAVESLRRSGRLVGQTISSLISAINPGLIVVGGGVSSWGHTFLGELRSAVYHRSMPLATTNLPIVASELGERAGAIGASLIAVDGALSIPTAQRHGSSDYMNQAADQLLA